MQFRHSTLALSASLYTAILCGSARAEQPRIEEMATAGINDLQASVRIVQSDSAELKKINRDFGLAYKLRGLVLRYKRPDKLRMEGRIGDAEAVYILNGSSSYFCVPKLHLTRREPLGPSPENRYSLMQVGLLSRADLRQATTHYLRDEPVHDTAAHVFEVTYSGDSNLKYVLWIDPHTHVILKRQWYDGEGKLRATFLYQGVQQVAVGLWLPTRMEVRNGEGGLAGITEYVDVKVNQGIAEDLFRITQSPGDKTVRVARNQTHPFSR